MFGSLEDFQELLTYAHNHGIKVLIDQVWSHTSDQHQWFLESHGFVHVEARGTRFQGADDCGGAKRQRVGQPAA